MSRPQKIHPPIRATFRQILGAVATGTGEGRKAAKKLAADASKKAGQKRE